MKSPLAKIGKAIAARDQYKKTGKMPKTRKDYDRIARKEIKAIRNSRTIPKWQKYGLVGAGALAATLAAYGGYKYYKNSKLRNQISEELVKSIVKEATNRKSSSGSGSSVSKQGVKANVTWANITKNSKGKKNYRKMFEDSIRTARESGVPENKILKSLEDGHRYFTSTNSKTFDDLDNITKDLLKKNSNTIKGRKKKG